VPCAAGVSNIDRAAIGCLHILHFLCLATLSGSFRKVQCAQMSLPSLLQTSPLTCVIDR
jgi:hypothetical protein